MELREVLEKWEADYGLSFSFDDALVEGKRITCRFENRPLEDALKILFFTLDLDFELLDGRDVLIKKSHFTEGEKMGGAPPPLPEHTICGRVTDAASGGPLPGATAYVKGSPEGTTTDADGRFSLRGNFSAKDSLEIRFLGYGTVTLRAAPFLDAPCGKFTLSISENWMPDVVISDFATDMLGAGEMGSFHFKKEKIPTLPGWGEPDVMRLLQLLPGIGSAQESASRLNVRGGTPDQNLVLWDGIPIYHTGHFFGLSDAFNPYVVEDVEVWRGNFGSEYGGRNSSVIDIKSRSEIVDETEWAAGVNLLSAQAYVHFPLLKKRGKKLAVLAAFRRSYVNGIQSSTYQKLFNQVFQNGKVTLEREEQNDEFVSWTPDISFADLNFKVHWEGKKKRKNAFNLFAASDELNYRFAYDDSTYFYEAIDQLVAANVGMSFQHSAEWSPTFKVKYQVAASNYSNEYSFQWNEEDRERPFIDRFQSKNVLDDFSVQLHHEWQAAENHRMSFGYHLSEQEFTLLEGDTNAVNRIGEAWANDTTRLSLHTFYADFDYEVGKRLGFQIGIRENYLPARELYYSEPRLSATWRPFANGLSVQGSVGRYWQFVFQEVEVDFGDLGVGEPLWVVSEDEIPPQELWQWTLGIRLEKKSLLLDAEVYHKKMRNLTSLNLRTDRGFDRPWSFDGQATARGMDFLLRKRLPPYSFWFSYSLGEVVQQFPELNNGSPFPARHDIRHQANFVNMLSLRKWELAANLHLRTGSPYSVPDVKQTDCPDCQSDDYTYILDYPHLNDHRLPGFVRLDLSATYQFGKKKSRGKIGLAIYNVLNRKNLLDKDVSLETAPYEEPQDNYKLQTLNRLAAGATPNLFVRFEW